MTLLVIWRSAMRETMSNRRSFWTQVSAMVANNIVWVAFWVLFFHRVGTVRGWDADTMLLLLAIVCTSFGIVLGLLANARHLGELIRTAQLDAVLALPVSPLPHLLVRRINPSNVGDIVFGLVLFAVALRPGPADIAAFLAVSLASAVLITAFLVLVGASAFWSGRADGDLSFHALLVFSSYPVDMFGGFGRLVLHTALPAAFVGAVPARLLTEPDGAMLLALVTATVVFVVLASAVFAAGLRRYTSGATWVDA